MTFVKDARATLSVGDEAGRRGTGGGVVTLGS